MSNVRRPLMNERTKSTPLTVTLPSATAFSTATTTVSRLGSSMLTPPASPRHAKSSLELSHGLTSTPTRTSIDSQKQVGGTFTHSVPKCASSLRTDDGILICSFDVEILKDQRNRDLIFGYGAWSTVYKGACQSKAVSGLMTPPSSPATKPPLLVAIKQPARKDARAIIESEARILSYLTSLDNCDSFVVPFYGMITTTSSLVLNAIPLSLEEHIRKSAVTSQATRTTWNMAEPVIGNTNVWQDLAQKLVSALSWLHDQALVVHGDIKPANILLDQGLIKQDMELREKSDHFLYKPLFADFSSSQRLDTDPTPNTLSAVTREYTAPELLSYKVLSDPASTATPASDVFSLAVTLLVAATGNTMVYTGSVFQRQAMATQGWMVLQAVRNGPIEEGARVPRQGVVERTLDQAVLRDGMGRIDATSWKAKIERMMLGEPRKI